MHQLRVGALISVPLHIITAQEYTGHPSPQAVAELGAGSLKYVSLLQPPALSLTAQLVLTCMKQTEKVCDVGDWLTTSLLCQVRAESYVTCADRYPSRISRNYPTVRALARHFQVNDTAAWPELESQDC